MISFVVRIRDGSDVQLWCFHSVHRIFCVVHARLIILRDENSVSVSVLSLSGVCLSNIYSTRISSSRTRMVATVWPESEKSSEL